jgi:hypothetical protein
LGQLREAGTTDISVFFVIKSGVIGQLTGPGAPGAGVCLAIKRFMVTAEDAATLLEPTSIPRTSFKKLS